MSGLAAQLRLLLPPESYDGTAPTLTALLGAEASGLDIAQISSDRLGEKIWPDTGAALDEYERVLGLPDPCLTDESLAVRQRIAAVMAKLNGSGGQSRAFFIQLAASLGYTININEFKPARAGIAVAGSAVNGSAWTSAWLINAEPVTVFVAKAGSAAAGEALAVWGNKLLECRMRAMQPAHATLIFGYGVN
ncbi:YmfQ family protein [Pseudomonas mosselii]|uniref:YmfQ family protein n=1 Tax=Pseudomonas mosselii TaxID=78327 RepID=UPI000BB4A731|nr:putative phage tail protein [Pseudomonas mosselii]ATB63772.1 phage tail protein [Pseudomonas mosselii]